jgi:FtsP/CotA-like multicopper oxidase with cupredoxin domain
MNRREFVYLAGGALGGAALGGSVAWAQKEPANLTLTIAETELEVGPGVKVKTKTYNGTAPGPLLRMPAGKRFTVDVVNQTKEPELVHWHGMQIPPDVDGAWEEGTPMIQALDRRRYSFVPQPNGTRWYHAHAMAGHDLTRAAYTGQFGMAIVEPASHPGRYDQEVPIVLHEWNGYFSSDMAMDVDYRTFTINGKVMGAGEPIRVKAGQRVLFRVLNASATVQHRIAFSGHRFQVVALDGNDLAKPVEVPVLDMSPGERVDAIVEMNNPGVWILGEEEDRQRFAGAGTIVEYANASGQPRWLAPAPYVWDYTAFGGSQASAEPGRIIPLVFEPRTDGNLWAINGKSYPKTDPFFVKPGVRNRLVFDNRCDMSHPVHLHRHTFELTRFAGKQTSGVVKDVVLVPKRSIVEVDLMANAPGASLFHCHQQFHMDFGFMALMQYDGAQTSSMPSGHMAPMAR